MKFEDLKLPDTADLERGEAITLLLHSVYDQMRAHYESKPEPEKLFEHPDMPGKKFRRLKVGEVREKTDFACSFLPNSNWVPCATWGWVVGEHEACHYYREVPQSAPKWRLPDPPSPVGYVPLGPEELFEPPDMPGKKFRKLKVGEVIREGDWVASKGNPPGKGFLKTVCAGLFVESDDSNNFYREVTEWRLPDPPAPVEYVPLEPGDIQPGSVVRCIGATWWKQVTGVRAENVTVCAAGNLSWQTLADGWEILRPGSKTWEPCKKIKP